MNAEARCRLSSTAGALIAGAAILATSLAAAADPWADTRPRPEQMLGTISCMSASCHGGSGARQESGELARHQFVHWLGSEAKYRDGRRAYDPRAELEQDDADPHALAARKILQPRFQEVLRRVSQRADGSVDAQAYERCAQCHDPLGIADSSAHAAMRGIGCESCHGGARQW